MKFWRMSQYGRFLSQLGFPIADDSGNRSDYLLRMLLKIEVSEIAEGSSHTPTRKRGLSRTAAETSSLPAPKVRVRVKRCPAPKARVRVKRCVPSKRIAAMKRLSFKKPNAVKEILLKRPAMRICRGQEMKSASLQKKPAGKKLLMKRPVMRIDFHMFINAPL